MSDEDSDTPCVSFFSNRAKLAPKKTPEELKAAEELLKKIEAEKNDEAGPSGIGTESFNTKQESLSKKRKKKNIPSQTAKNSRPGPSSQPSGNSESANVVNKREIIDHELENVRLSAAARRRLKKLRNDQELDCMLIDAKNAMILEGNPFKRPELTEEPPTIPEEKILHLTVSYLSKVARFKCYEKDNFFKVFQDVGQFFQLKPSEFLLCLNDRNITVTDTPQNISLSDLDILECIPYKAEASSESALDDDTFTLTFQSNDSKSKIDMVVNKMEKMQTIMQRYAEKRSLPISELTFEFDGEILLGTETPVELDMEAGNCVDVRVFVPQPECSYSRNDKPAEDNSSYQNFIWIDDDNSNGSDVQILD